MAENGKNKDKEKVSELYDLVVKEGFSELEYKNGAFHIRLKRRQKRSAAKETLGKAYEETTAAAGLVQALQNTIKAPLNGTFYRSPSPQHPPFVHEGDIVEQGAVLCLIEAMKVMNEIRAEARIRIAKMLVENGKNVNAGQDIFVIENQ